MLKEKTCFPYEWLAKENILDKELPSIDKFYSSDTKVKADMFNKFFFNQFSDASSYDIDISFESDNNFDIDFNTDKIKDILRNIDCNKAQGPDKIHGIILKNLREFSSMASFDSFPINL